MRAGSCRSTSPSRPQGRDCLGSLHARDPTFRPRAASREASAGPVVQPLHSLEGGEARQTRRSVHRAKAALGLVKSPTVIDGIRSESQVRTRLTAGGRRIRTLGPPSEGFMQTPRSPPIASRVLMQNSIQPALLAGLATYHPQTLRLALARRFMSINLAKPTTRP